MLAKEEVKNNAFGFLLFFNNASNERINLWLLIALIFKTYIDPYKPTDTKPKTDKQKERSIASREALNKQLEDFVSSNKVEDIKQNSVSKKEAKQRVNQFFS